MAASTESIYFVTLSVTAISLLWGVSLWNGTVKELILATLHGNFSDGTPFKTNYTGIIFIDFPLSLLVAFFFYGTNGSDTGYQLFLIDAYSTLQSAFVWVYVEACRVSEKPTAVQNPIIWGAIWQAFGAAISLPLYYFNHLKWIRSVTRPLAAVPAAASKAIPISFLLGAVVPAIIGMMPTWVDRPARLHQNILAAWQPDPVWVAAIQAGCTSMFAGTFLATRKEEDAAFRWVRLSYLMASLSSTTGHLYAVGRIILSSDPMLSITRVYVPYLFSGPAGSSEKLANGPWLFLQYDLIIIGLSSVSWAYILVSGLVDQKSGTQNFLPIVFLLGWLTIGPGGTVSLALFWREGKLRSLRSAARKGLK